jgi:hypothetical protein
MNMIYLNKQLALLILALVTVTVQAQNISIDECQAKARANYPLIKQVGLIEQSTAYQLSNANKAWLPQLSLTAKASYQSDAIKISLPAPINLNMEQSKDQYSVALDVTQTVWDGGITKAQKGIIKAQSEAEKQKAEVDLYAIRDRVNQLFFGILLINEQLSQVKTLQHDLATNLKKIKADLKYFEFIDEKDLTPEYKEEINRLNYDKDDVEQKMMLILMALQNPIYNRIANLTEVEKAALVTEEYKRLKSLKEKKLGEAMAIVLPPIPSKPVDFLEWSDDKKREFVENSEKTRNKAKEEASGKKAKLEEEAADIEKAMHL